MATAVLAAAWAFAGAAQAEGGDARVSGGTLYVYGNDGKKLGTYTVGESNRTLDGTGLSGSVEYVDDRWVVTVTSGSLQGSIYSRAGLEVRLEGGEAGIWNKGRYSALYGRDGVRITGPGVLLIDHEKQDMPAIEGENGGVVITMGAVVGVNSLASAAYGVAGPGIRVTASALHVNAIGSYGIHCGAGDVEIDESIVTVASLKSAVYLKQEGRLTVTASCVHLVSSGADAVQCGTGTADSVSVVDSVFCLLGAQDGIRGTGQGSGTALSFHNVVGAIVGADCGIFGTESVSVSGGATKLAVAGNLLGEYTLSERDARPLTLSSAETACGAAVSMASSWGRFGVEAGSVKLFAPGRCALACGTTEITGGKLEAGREAGYQDFQTLFTWAGAVAAGEVLAARNVFSLSDPYVGVFFETQALAAMLTSTAALFSGERRAFAGIKADMVCVTGGNLSVEASGTGILLDGDGGSLVQEGGRIAVESKRVGIADGYAAGGGTATVSSSCGLVISGGRMTAKGEKDGVLTSGSVVLKGGTMEVAATGGGTAGTISANPGLAGYALGANNGFSIDGGSFLATGGKLRTTPATSSAHGSAAVHPCDLEVPGADDETALAISGMQPSWYGVTDLYPVGGTVRLWLPEGPGALTCGETVFKANGTGTVVPGTNRFTSSEQAMQTVTFDANGGQCATASYRYLVGGTYGWLPTPTLAGHVFAGWFSAIDGGTEVTAESTVGAETSRALHAHWSESGGTETGKPRITEFQVNPATGCKVRGTGEAGKTYRLEKAPEPSGAWKAEGEAVVAATGGQFEWTVDVASGTRQGFYRVAEGESAVRPAKYLVVDLSGGSEAARYPVSELNDVPAGGWTDEYKRTKLVLRRIEGGTFTMGSPTNELGRRDNEIQHAVTLTKPFYMGVFEVTQRQWELTMENRPSFFNNSSYYATRPVESVSYNDIRGASAGAGWPTSDAVDATSFLGVLRAKTGLKFDLPTEAQWEYTCRAGTVTALNSGKDLTELGGCTNMAEVGRYYDDSWDRSCDTAFGTAKVGSFLPNHWGIYDMHGNVWEWCLDWYGSYDTGDAVDPVGHASGSYRVMRGGCWNDGGQFCRSAYRADDDTSSSFSDHGFRLCCPAGLP